MSSLDERSTHRILSTPKARIIYGTATWSGNQ